MQKIPFFKPSHSNKELELISQVINKENDNIVENFEESIKKYFNSKFAIAVNNGTSAIHLSLCAMNLKRADKFICSVNSFPNIAQSIRHFDAEPIFVDINEDDFNINIDAFEKTLKENKHKKLKGAFITHVAGQAAQMDEIYKIAKEYDIKILDDINYATGTTYNGQKVGSLKQSFISCLQTTPHTKGNPANAACLLTNDEEIYEQAILFRNNGMTFESNQKDSGLNYIYDVVEIGQEYGLDELCAAYNLVQFQKLDSFIKRRKEIAEIYNEELKSCSHITTPVAKRDHVYSQYIIKIDKNRDNFAKELENVGIHTGLHFKPLYLLSYYKQKYNYKINDFPNALKVYQQILSLPIYPSLTNEQVHYICEKVKSIAQNRQY